MILRKYQRRLYSIQMGRNKLSNEKDLLDTLNGNATRHATPLKGI